MVEVFLYPDERIADVGERAEQPFGIVGSAVADTQEVRQPRRRKLVDSLSFVSPKHVIQEFAHLGFIAGQACCSGGVRAFRAGQRCKGKADMSKDIENVAVGCIDQSRRSGEVPIHKVRWVRARSISVKGCP